MALHENKLYKESEIFIGKLPTYEEYKGSVFSEYKSEHRRSEINNKLNSRVMGYILKVLVSTIILAVLVMVGINRAYSFNVGYLFGEGLLVTILILSGILSSLLAWVIFLSKGIMTSFRLDYENANKVNKYDVDKALKGEYRGLGEDDRVYSKDRYINAVKGDIDNLNYYVLIEDDSKSIKEVTRLYNILDVYDNGRLMNNIDFKITKDGIFDGKDLSAQCKEAELSDDDLVKYYTILSTGYYIKLDKGEEIPESNFQKNQQEIEESYLKNKRYKGVMGNLNTV